MYLTHNDSFPILLATKREFLSMIYEDFIMDKGKTLNTTFMDYKMTGATDVPNIEVIDIITDGPDGPFGAKEDSGVALSALPLLS